MLTSALGVVFRILFYLCLALGVWGIGSGTWGAFKGATRVARSQRIAIDDDVEKMDKVWEEYTKGHLQFFISQMEADLAGQSTAGPGSSWAPDWFHIGLTEGMTISELVVDVLSEKYDPAIIRARIANKWVIWMDERMGYQPLYAATVKDLESKTKGAFESAYENDTDPPKYSIVAGPFATKEAAIDAAEAKLTNVRRFASGPGAVYPNMLVGDIGKDVHNIESLPVDLEQLNWAEGHGPDIFP